MHNKHKEPVLEKPFTIVVLISGNGSNLQALIDKQLEFNFKISAVISNSPNAKGLKRSESANIDNIIVDNSLYKTREEFDSELIKKINKIKPNLIVLAGFMRILTANFTNQYTGKIINIHPSLLPKYKGLRTHERVLESQDLKHGASIHMVNSKLDEGAIIMQASVDVLIDDTPISLKTKVQKIEHVIYPLTIKWFAEKKFKFIKNKIWLDQKLLDKNGYQYCIK